MSKMAKTTCSSPTLIGSPFPPTRQSTSSTLVPSSLRLPPGLSIPSSPCVPPTYPTTPAPRRPQPEPRHYDILELHTVNPNTTRYLLRDRLNGGIFHGECSKPLEYFNTLLDTGIWIYDFMIDGVRILGINPYHLFPRYDPMSMMQYIGSTRAEDGVFVRNKSVLQTPEILMGTTVCEGVIAEIRRGESKPWGQVRVLGFRYLGVVVDEWGRVSGLAYSVR